MAGLLARAGVRHVLAADVYGRGPAGGNALAIARAVDWLIGRQVRVITISLVGPANPVLARAMTAALQRGAVIVAAVGNDGPAAPPAYPASYPGVLAVTAVDARNRALIEAGRALHLDYAAPGAGLRAANAAGQMVPVRGTSFAAPLVASRVAAARDAHASLPQALDREAIDLGPRGPDRSMAGACSAPSAADCTGPAKNFRVMD
ncbi:S8 family serine peptidase [Novosphingobium pokkalii]|uniref:S8 family serine peptidase n=1 Tax=Novosphingobium pokkalii TaxID=1770194 RepID=UPI0036389693